MPESMSRTIGHSISRWGSAKRGTGPTSTIWWIIGVSGILAPAIRAILGDQAPQAITTRSAASSPRVVCTPRTRPPVTDSPRTSVSSITVAPAPTARSRMIVAACTESTTPAAGE